MLCHNELDLLLAKEKSDFEVAQMEGGNFFFSITCLPVADVEPATDPYRRQGSFSVQNVSDG